MADQNSPSLESLRHRKPGDAIPKELIRMLRDRKHWDQGELAYNLGLPSGRNVVDAWESGRSRCEGPAAELVLRLLGLRDLALLGEALSGLVDAEWLRAGPDRAVRLWRQFIAIPESEQEVDADTWASLFPRIAIPAAQRVHGFPFIPEGLPAEVVTRGPDAWKGSVPSREEDPPGYLWILRADGQFAYRERAWEEDPMAITRGNILVASILELVLAGTFFVSNVFRTWNLAPETRVLLRADLHGLKGRGIVANVDETGNLVDVPTSLSSENQRAASINATVAEVTADPKRRALSLVAELVRPLRPDLAQTAALEFQLARRLRFDKGQPGFRTLGFLDNTIQPSAQTT
jgi:DNA-binding transcriptional regulator YiaG